MDALHDASASSPVAERLLSEAQSMRRLLENHEARLVAILDRHVEAGTGPAPEEVLAATGYSSFEARAAASRARLLNGLNSSLHDDALHDDALHDDARETDDPVADGHATNDDSGHDANGDPNGGADGAGFGSGFGGGGRDDRPTPPPINPENLDAIRRAEKQFKTDAERAAFAKRKPELARLAASLNARDFAARLKKVIFAVVSEFGVSLKERQRKASSFKSWTDKDGMVYMHGRFDPERGGAITSGIEREMKAEAKQAHDAEGIRLPMDDNLAASALFRICERAFDPNRRASRPLVGLLVDAKTLQSGEHPDTISESMGAADWVDAATRRRWLCDCDLQKVIVDDQGEPTDVGRRYRTATPAQRLALRAVYRSCGFPGCDCVFDWCQLHHVGFWELGGETNLDNLLPLCSRHHHLVHEGGWTLRLEPGRVAAAWRPDGTLHARSTPDGPARRHDQQHDQQRPDSLRCLGPASGAPPDPSRSERGNPRPSRQLVGAPGSPPPSLFDEREPSHN